MNNNTLLAFSRSIAIFRTTKISHQIKTPIKNSELSLLIYIVNINEPHKLNVDSLSKAFHCSKPFITKTLNSLEKAGYISREKSNIDCRRQILRTTPLGIKIAQDSMNVYNTTIEKLYTRLGNEKSTELTCLLYEAADILHEIDREIRTEDN